MIGRDIGNYRITNELAQGGMGSVYRGVHLHLPRQVVVKSILMKSFTVSAQRHLKARFKREAFIQSQLDHPNIVRVYEFFAMDDNYYLVMEYVPGMSLKELIRKPGLLGDFQAINLCTQALEALYYAHNFVYKDESGNRQKGVIHRDIKPANLLIDRNGRLKITDFGIVKVSGDDDLTQSGFQPGTVEYMSPEQLLGIEVTEKSDIYCLGVTLYELLTGRLPFPRSVTGSDWEVRKGHIEKLAPPISQLRSDIDPALSSILMKTLNKKPNDRFHSTKEFHEALIACSKNLKTDKSTIFCLMDKNGKPISPFAAVSGALNVSINVTDNTVTGPGPVNSSIEFPFRAISKAGEKQKHDKYSDTLSISEIIDNAPEPPPIVREGNGSHNLEDKKRGILFASYKADQPPIKNSSTKKRSRRKVLVSVPIGKHAGHWRGFIAIGSLVVAASLYLLMPSHSDSIRTIEPKSSGSVSIKKAGISPGTSAGIMDNVPDNPVDNTATSYGIMLTHETSHNREAPDVRAGATQILDQAVNNIKKSPLVKEALLLEQQGKFNDAIRKYEEYLHQTPNGNDVTMATENLSRHKTFNALMKSGDDAIIRGDHDTARLNYKEAIKLRPNSRTARTGFSDAQDKYNADLKKKIKMPPIKRMKN